MFRSGCRPEAYSPPPLIPSRESGLDVIKIRPSQLKSVSRRLKDYVVTETPPSPVAMTSLSEDSGGEHERKSAAGFGKFLTRFGSHERICSPSSLGTVASRTVSKLEETSSPSETTKYRTTPPSGESKPEQDPVVRASCFADTLARMEGRVPRIPLSPIVRYVRSERVYKDNVELEHDSPVLECPRPVNGAIGARMDRLLQVGTVDSSDELELHDSETPDWLSERPMNPTPERAIFHNDEATTPISIAI